ncbi:helix-turn-helix domain-containing protein [Parapedobacter pyrenivorans]|uniref:helix-turn-helix domain-containing protein n=1 Tax=Parapedobacter pyrenivorans TaxID=1305674 RepID=UPI00333ED352
MAKIVATNIRRVREYRNYTQKHVASSLGISQNAYSKLELGESKITMERFFEIANILNVSYAGLMERYEDDIVQLRIEQGGANNGIVQR